MKTGSNFNGLDKFSWPIPQIMGKVTNDRLFRNYIKLNETQVWYEPFSLIDNKQEESPVCLTNSFHAHCGQRVNQNLIIPSHNAMGVVYELVSTFFIWTLEDP